VSRHRATRPELFLAVAIVVLILQLLTNLVIQLLGLFDLRTRMPRTWFSSFAVLFTFLCLIRFGPEVTDRFREQFSQRVKDRARRNLLRLAAKQLSEQEEW
jgi:hypothetical protein